MKSCDKCERKYADDEVFYKCGNFLICYACNIEVGLNAEYSEHPVDVLKTLVKLTPEIEAKLRSICDEMVKIPAENFEENVNPFVAELHAYKILKEECKGSIEIKYPEGLFAIAIDPKKLAEEHWNYVGALLNAHGHNNLTSVEFNYKSAFIHGFKHGVEACGGK